MKFAYEFSNLLGTVYRKGNVTFTPDGNSVVSPVGNRVTVFDLKNNKSGTLPIESRLNISCVALAPNGMTMIIVDEEGEAMLCSLVSKTVLHYYHFHRPVHDIKFSPDGSKFAVTKERNILLFRAPGHNMEFNPFVLERTFYGSYDDTVCIDWTTDSRVFCMGSKDMNTRVYGAERFSNLVVYSIGGHSDCIVGTFFEKDSLDVYSISQNGQLCVWECDTELSGLKPYEPPVRDDSSDDDENDDVSEEGEEDVLSAARRTKEKEEQEKAEQSMVDKILYKRSAKHNFKSVRGEGQGFVRLTSAAYHKDSHILVTGFQDGAFFLHEMPEFNLIHSLSISNQPIAAISFNKPGDWIALGCSGLGQLLVWEWQSETYVLKQQGHFNNMSCLVYSPDGQYIATGADDGKVKVWNTSTGFCFVTFTEHLAGITGVTFSQNGQVVVSSSLDGTVRAYDLNRYRNFRTFTSPRPAQFSCLAMDPSGDLVCAGGRDVFEIFVWSMKTGRLLEILAGHEGPISSLAFCSSHAILVSGSWDKTVKFWDIFENKGARETLDLNSDVLAVTYRPDGEEVAVATLNAQITFWNVHTAQQTGCIEGRHDIGSGRKEADKITAKKSSFGKAFNTLCYTADGSCVLAGGKSKNICIYSISEQLLMKKFEISCNMSFDGMEEYLDRRKMTEWGSLALVDESESHGRGEKISLPGVKKGDMSSRHWKPEVRVASVQFSPTGRAWAAVTTEGLVVYSLDDNMVFDPFDLEIDITPANVKKCLSRQEYSSALMLAFRLNVNSLKQEVLEATPIEQVEVICQALPDTYIDKLLAFISTQLESSAHIEFYLTWCSRLLEYNGPKLKTRSRSILPQLHGLQKALTRKCEDLSKVCDHNKYNLSYLISLGETNRKRKLETGNDGKEAQENSDLMEEDSSDSDAENILSELREKWTPDSSEVEET